MSKLADHMKHARANAKAWLASIEEMNAAHVAAYDDIPATEAAQTAIYESALSVQIRSGWYSPGSTLGADHGSPEEYEILLSTGGPALRIIGRLSEHCEPESAELQMQDWGTPWTHYPAPESELLAFAQQFYFGA